MANRTQIVCLHEGKKGHSIDDVFINRFIKSLDPSWIRPFKGSNRLRLIDCGGRTSLIERMPTELKVCLSQGGNTTLMVLADVDHDMQSCEDLKNKFWQQAQTAGITQQQFDQVVFVFAKDRLENWLQYLNTGSTDESVEGSRKNHTDPEVTTAARKLASRCQANQVEPPLPLSLQWSCKNWHALSQRLSKS